MHANQRRRRHGDGNLRQSSGHVNRRARLHRLLRPTNDADAYRTSFADIVKHEPLSYVDVYRLLAVTSALMFLLCFLLEKNEPAASGEIQVH